MSAPDTDLDKQAKRHRGPIWGITFGLVCVALLALAAFVWPGLPLDQQAAPDGAPTETSDGDAVSGGPSIVIDSEADAATGETQ
ncbi:hypothetical protein roselon_02834 [Roseibacterium elongatum DSM 19469]|uniref:Uncharacterized protein n=1 Tax=Roseicyclus elongatus DSM 19469 TaxID=1294273 RepID=W8S4J5_9RHOB|nr:hypothetical protein [Roseibacterium elongatum]AHM05132.1 hypothetical protein roselon_02834 [Roseibacterium elongatum DSM 19469]